MSSVAGKVASALSVLAATSSSAFVIETTSQWNGSDSISYIGNPTFATATYGQTFKVTQAAELQSWTFWLANRSSSPQPEVHFDGCLTEWAGDRAVGDVLFASTGRTVPASPRGEFHALTFDVPNVLLRPEKSYVMFLNTSPYETLQQPFQLAALGAVGDKYGDGAFWYQNSYNLFQNVFDHPWTCGDEGRGCRYGDTAFQAEFAAVPEPTSGLLLLLGAAVLLTVPRSGRCVHEG